MSLCRKNKTGRDLGSTGVGDMNSARWHLNKKMHGRDGHMDTEGEAFPQGHQHGQGPKCVKSNRGLEPADEVAGRDAGPMAPIAMMTRIPEGTEQWQDMV